MTDRRATCSCGRLSVQARGEPVRVSVCHCLCCQRRTGSAFGVQARYAEDAVTVAGESRTFARAGDEGTTATFHFCLDCGVTVYWRANAIPGFVTVPVGAFADPAFPAPTVVVYGDRQHPWLRLADDIASLDPLT